MSLRVRVARIIEALRPRQRSDIELVLTIVERDEHGDWPDPLPDPEVRVILEDEP